MMPMTTNPPAINAEYAQNEIMYGSLQIAFVSLGEETAQPTASARVDVPRPVYLLRNESHISNGKDASTTIPRVLHEYRHGDTKLDELIRQAEEMKAEDSPQPTDEATNRIFLYMTPASTFLPPDGYAYGDGEGGMEVEWRKEERRLRLFVHSSDPQEDYIYWSDELVADGEKKYGIFHPFLIQDNSVVGCNGFRLASK